MKYLMFVFALLFSAQAHAAERCDVNQMKRAAKATVKEFTVPLGAGVVAGSIGGSTIGGAILIAKGVGVETALTYAGATASGAIISFGTMVVVGSAVGIGGVATYVCRQNISDWSADKAYRVRRNVEQRLK